VITCWSIADGALQWTTAVPPGTVSNRSAIYASHSSHGIVSSDLGAVYWTVSGEKDNHWGSLIFLSSNGAIITQQRIPAPIKTAFMADDTVITLDRAAHVRAFNIAGELLWSFALPPSVTGFYHHPHLLSPVGGRIGCARGERVFIMDLGGNLLWQWQFPILTRPSEGVYTFGLTDDDIPPDLDFGDDEGEEEKIQLVFNVGALLPDGRLLVQSTSGQLFELSADGKEMGEVNLPAARRGFFFYRDSTACLFGPKSIFFMQDFKVVKRLPQKPNTFGQMFVENPGCFIFWGGYELDSGHFGHFSIFTPDGTTLVAHVDVPRPRCAAPLPQGLAIAYLRHIDLMTLAHSSSPVTEKV
jgi:outer membrane protein assembly factor BamB